jgi:catechol 2,3-dioxygenase-like lactoylglutathione lyase family enzyme
VNPLSESSGYQLQVITLPVSDVDRSVAFYTERAGFELQVDYAPNDDFRVVQVTPGGSACSVQFGVGVTDAQPGSVRGTYLVVDDIEAAHAELQQRGVEVSDVQDFPWGRFVFFNDPDGNRWSVQYIPPRD